MGKPKAPAAPDYAAAATAQGAANTEAARTSSKLSNPNIINPYGSQTVTYGGQPVFNQQGYDDAMAQYNDALAKYNAPSSTGNPGVDYINGLTGGNKGPAPVAPDRNSFMVQSGDPDVPTVTQTLSPTQQALFDQNNRISAQFGDLAENAMGNVAKQGIGTSLDMTNIPPQAVAGQQGWDNAYNAITQRNQPFMDRQESMLKTQLANQGLAPDSEAYKNAMMDLTQQQNNFNLGAQAQATDQQQAQFGMDTNARQNAINQAITLRELPMNEANALRTGSQISVPQFQQFSGTQTAPAPIMQGVQNQYQAAQNAYGQQSANYNNMMSGLFGLGGAAAMAPTGSFAGLAGLFSDKRLKENIEMVGITYSGIPIYVYNYIGSDVKHMGVMAQEVEETIPEAVLTHESGYKMVDYGMVR